MFNPSKGKSHLCKIQKRREFLATNFETIRNLLHWPNPIKQEKEYLYELYVSKSTYWWMFNTPYPVPTEFVQIDLLENWFRKTINSEKN